MMALQRQHSRLVRTRDGMVCQCNESVWMDSPLLRSSAARDSRPFKVDCNKHTWFDLEVAHREGKFPIDLLDLYRLLAVAVQLDLRKLIRPCLRHLLAAPDFWKYQFPKDTPDEVLLLYVKETLKCLFRTPEVYRHAVDEILSLSRGLKLTETFLNEFNSKLRDFTELGLERVPISFHIPCVPIVLARQQGELRTAIYIEKSLLWCDLFGKNFDLSTFNTNSFHIKYASYVLYKSAQKVYYKDLRSRTTVRRVLRNCEFFISRKYTVLAVTHEYSESRVWMWVENEEYGGKFKVIHASPDEIKCVDFEPEGTFLITKKDGSLSTAVLGPHRLIIITEHRGEFVYAFFHNENMYAFSLKEGKKIAFNVHSFWRVAPSQWVECKGFHGRRALEEFAEDGGVFPLGGELFRLSKRGLEVKPPGDSPFLLLRPGEFVGVSELHLHP